MDAAQWLGLVARWLHILAAMAAVGGMIFARLALLPALDALPAGPRRDLEAAVRARWSKVVMASIGFLLLSGFYNFFAVSLQGDYGGPLYHALFGVKFLLAMAIFGLSSLLAGRSAAAERLRVNGRRWLTVNLALAVLVVCISGVMRSLEWKPKQPAAPVQPATVSDLLAPAAEKPLHG